MRVADAGLRVYEEKPDLMYALLKEWIDSEKLLGVDG